MAISPITGGLPIGATAPVSVPAQVAPAASPGGSGFGDLLAQGLNAVSTSEKTADALISSAAAGGPVQPHEIMIATSKASLAIELTVAVRDKALEAYRDVINLQL